MLGIPHIDLVTTWRWCFERFQWCNFFPYRVLWSYWLLRVAQFVTSGPDLLLFRIPTCCKILDLGVLPLPIFPILYAGAEL